MIGYYYRRLVTKYDTMRLPNVGTNKRELSEHKKHEARSPVNKGPGDTWVFYRTLEQ
jgi:hypothetical protein